MIHHISLYFLLFLFRLDNPEEIHSHTNYLFSCQVCWKGWPDNLWYWKQG